MGKVREYILLRLRSVRARLYVRTVDLARELEPAVRVDAARQVGVPFDQLPAKPLPNALLVDLLVSKGAALVRAEGEGFRLMKPREVEHGTFLAIQDALLAADPQGKHDDRNPGESWEDFTLRLACDASNAVRKHFRKIEEGGKGNDP